MPVTLPATYFQLVNQFPLTKIRDEKHLAEAQEMLDEVLSLEQDEGVEAYVDVLSDLIEAYETEHLPFPGSAAGDVLAELMASNGMTTEVLSEATGIATVDLAAILAGSRPPSPGEVEVLSAYFHASPAVFQDNLPSGHRIETMPNP